jgi:hypothetical protein
MLKDCIRGMGKCTNNLVTIIRLNRSALPIDCIIDSVCSF